MNSALLNSFAFVEGNFFLSVFLFILCWLWGINTVAFTEFTSLG